MLAVAEVRVHPAIVNRAFHSQPYSYDATENVSVRLKMYKVIYLHLYVVNKWVGQKVFITKSLRTIAISAWLLLLTGKYPHSAIVHWSHDEPFRFHSFSQQKPNVQWFLASSLISSNVEFFVCWFSNEWINMRILETKNWNVSCRYQWGIITQKRTSNKQRKITAFHKMKLRLVICDTNFENVSLREIER